MSVSVDDRVNWFLQMPPQSYPRPSWIADELTAKIYESGLDRISKEDLKKMIMSCGHASPVNPPSDPKPIPEEEVDQMLKDFFNYHEYTDKCNLRIFLFQFTRKELFHTIRHLRSQFGKDTPVRQLQLALAGAAGTYQGGKMSRHLSPDQFADVISLNKVAEFYFKYEAMLTKDAVEGGILSTFDIPKEILQAVEDNAAKQVSMLLKHPKADPNMLDSFNTPLLHLAIAEQQVDVYNVLLKNGANPNILTKEGNTALHVALHDLNMDLLQELITSNADINLVATDGNTPLHTAVSICNDFAVRALLGAGADKTIQNKEGKTALDLATAENDKELVALLTDTPADEAPAAEAPEAPAGDAAEAEAPAADAPPAEE